MIGDLRCDLKGKCLHFSATLVGALSWIEDDNEESLFRSRTKIRCMLMVINPEPMAWICDTAAHGWTCKINTSMPKSVQNSRRM